jgi:hypothetical protein
VGLCNHDPDGSDLTRHPPLAPLFLTLVADHATGFGVLWSMNAGGERAWFSGYPRIAQIFTCTKADPLLDDSAVRKSRRRPNFGH